VIEKAIGRLRLFFGYDRAALTARYRMRLIALGLVVATTISPAARAELPTGFGPIVVGQAWIDIEGTFPYQDLSDASTLPERLSQECGYKHVSMTTDKGQLLVTTNDFVITEVSFVTPLEEGSDLMAVADLVMQTYGQPRSASMRTALGQATIDRQRVSHIELAYESEHPVTFFVSGSTLWRYQINVRFARSRWHQNKTYRCAREREKALNEAAAEAAAKKEPPKP
jgi:hypothetical protein